MSEAFFEMNIASIILYEPEALKRTSNPFNFAAFRVKNFLPLFDYVFDGKKIQNKRVEDAYCELHKLVNRQGSVAVNTITFGEGHKQCFLVRQNGRQGIKYSDGDYFLPNDEINVYREIKKETKVNCNINFKLFLPELNTEQTELCEKLMNLYVHYEAWYKKQLEAILKCKI
jgi:hypothetical protein